MPANPVDIIAAIATAPGCGGIGVVRVSGPALAGLAYSLTAKKLLPRTATLTHFLADDGAVIDQGIALYFPAPHSFTGEDVLELQGHGGPVVMQLLLRRCVSLGARLAEPGEFSRRAFLNDKLDLAQAESVADLIEASTEAAVRAAMRSLQGEFSRKIHHLVDQLIELRALLEATLDFPEEEVDFLQETNARGRLAAIAEEIDRIRTQSRRGSLLRAGINVVLAGQPNAGKSSLLNSLAGQDRAIVTDIPGTTRDALRETIQIEGIPLHIVDTAGLRETADRVERLGIERTWKEVEQADVVVLLRDSRDRHHPEDERIAAQLPGGIPRVVVWNKIDLVKITPGRSEGEVVEIALSAKTGAGMDLLVAELLRIAGWQQGAGESVVLARERHLQALATAAEHVAEAGRCGWQLELLAEELRLAQRALSEITGEFTPDDLLGQIFSRFCIGK
ncbi:MAG: GTPase [Pseudomonadota bacterium]